MGLLAAIALSSVLLSMFEAPLPDSTILVKGVKV
jgi:hypothetical protein